METSTLFKRRVLSRRGEDHLISRNMILSWALMAVSLEGLKGDRELFSLRQ
jgi:hypothetical protein